MTGPAAPPNVVCLDTGDSVRLSPARIEGVPGVYCGVCVADVAHANAWCGDLPVPVGDSARLWIEADGQHHRYTASWPPPPPPREQPAPQPKLKRR